MENGKLKKALFVPSPNFDARPFVLNVSKNEAHQNQNKDARQDNQKISLIVLHAISLPPNEFGSEAILDFFQNKLDPNKHPYFATIAAQKVSAHFLIRRDGKLIQLVSCHARAWHAGVSSWRGFARCNDFSIGIELEGSDFCPFENAQYATLIPLINALKKEYPIVDVVGHSAIAPGRKTDPGDFFEWARISECTK